MIHPIHSDIVEISTPNTETQNRNFWFIFTKVKSVVPLVS